MEKILKSLLAILLFAQTNNLAAMNQEKSLEEKFSKIEINMNKSKAYIMGLEFLEANELEIAFQYFEYAANKNHFNSQIQLTYMLMDGAGCEKDLAAALELCNIVKKISFNRAEKARATENIRKEIFYRKIYNEFKLLWEDLVTEILTNGTEISKLALLPLIEQGAMQIQGEDNKDPEDQEEDDDKISDEFRDKIYC
ncbi:MAG: hypothetical protein SZ59_C0002G0071 [candidate division TM6 bacterium GW2011_GWF2_28_16]|nr:MAG: hypothetical protein SZ59_C0002G0071 [candidate division TM6 bacterium GW2011_GWF2_28_16]